MTVETIDITPTWKAVLPIMTMALRDGTPKGQRLAVEELERMAECADRWNAHCRAQEEPKPNAGRWVYTYEEEAGSLIARGVVGPFDTREEADADRQAKIDRFPHFIPASPTELTASEVEG